MSEHKRQPTCSVSDDGGHSSGPDLRRGMCTRHYRRWQRHGDPSVVLKPYGATPPRLCHCGQPMKAKGLCNTHYHQVRRERSDRGPCCHEGCSNRVYLISTGECYAHYRRRIRVRTPRTVVPCVDCGAEGTWTRSGRCGACYLAWYNVTKRGRTPRPKPAPAPEPRVLTGEWLERDGVTVVHWPKGVACPICDAESAQVA